MSMEDFVLYDEALEMRCIGFNEPCFATFKDNQLDYHTKTQMQNNSIPINSEYRKESKWISAPTYAQCFRWFRNIGYDFWLPKLDDKYQYVIRFDFGYTGGLDSRTNITSYEEAELLCLRNLIELYKQKINREKLGK